MLEHTLEPITNRINLVPKIVLETDYQWAMKWVISKLLVAIQKGERIHNVKIIFFFPNVHLSGSSDTPGTVQHSEIIAQNEADKSK